MDAELKVTLWLVVNVKNGYIQDVFNNYSEAADCCDNYNDAWESCGWDGHQYKVVIIFEEDIKKINTFSKVR